MVSDVHDDPGDTDIAGGGSDPADDWLVEVLAGRRPVIEPATVPPAGTIARSPAVSPGLQQLVDEATPIASPGLRELVANSVAPSTRAAYERDWADFDLWCQLHGVGEPLEASPVVVGEYLNELVRDRKAVSTINRRLAAIGFCQQVARVVALPTTR